MNTEQSDILIQKTANVAFTYYPEIHVDDQDFDLWSEVDYCVDHLTQTDIDQATLQQLKPLIARVIIDPTKHRVELADFLFQLTGAADD